MRVFLTIEVPRDIKEELSTIQERLRSEITGVRWERPEKLHITLVFLGTVEEGRILELEKAVRKGVNPAPHRVRGKRVKGFEVGFSEVGVFPKSGRPRVVLVEVGEGREEIEKLQKSLVEALAGEGFDFARLSKPHVTLGRFTRQNCQFGRVKARG